MSQEKIHEMVEKYLDDYIYGGEEYELENLDYASGLFRQAENLDALVLLSMIHQRRMNVGLTMHLMSRSAELYLKACLARYYSKQGLSHEEMIKELRKASSGFRYEKAEFAKNPSGFIVYAKRVPRNPHSLVQLWQTCHDVLGHKYNLRDNHHWSWVENFCLRGRDGKDKEEWYDLIYEPDEKIAWSKNGKGGLMNNETGFIKSFAEDFLKKVLPLETRKYHPRP